MQSRVVVGYWFGYPAIMNTVKPYKSISGPTAYKLKQEA